MLAQRVASAIVLAPLLLLAVAFDGLWYLAVVAVAALVANWELYSLLRRAGYLPLWPFGVALTIAFLLDASWPAYGPPLGVHLLSGQIAFPALALTLVFSLVYLVLRQQMDGSLVGWAVTWVPPLYVGFLLSFLISLRLLPSGDRWVYLMLGVTWATDTAAYFVGRTVGRRSFFSRISPRKTAEGALGGVVAGILCGTFLAWLFGWDLLRLIACALVVSVAATVGDLAESLMKRQLRAKDAGRLIPGHGGLLDRMDSLLFAGAATYWWALWIGGAS